MICRNDLYKEKVNVNHFNIKNLGMNKNNSCVHVFITLSHMGFSGMMGSNKAKNQKRNPTGRTGGEPVGILQV